MTRLTEDDPIVDMNMKSHEHEWNPTRAELDKVPEHEAVSEVEEAILANGEVQCSIGQCNFIISPYSSDIDYEEISNDLWTHRYAHRLTGDEKR